MLNLKSLLSNLFFVLASIHPQHTVLFLYLINMNLVQLAEIFIMKRKKVGNIDFSTCIMHIFQGHNKVNIAGVLL